jgi:hypothetical protein
VIRKVEARADRLVWCAYGLVSGIYPQRAACLVGSERLMTTTATRPASHPDLGGTRPRKHSCEVTVVNRFSLKAGEVSHIYWMSRRYDT